MLARLVQKGCTTQSQIISRLFSTTPAVTGVQSDVTASKWKLYRVASVGLLGGLTACFICPGNAIVDFATVTLLVHHNYAGLNSVIADYCPLFFPDSITAAVRNIWFVISILTLALLYGFNYRDVGFSKALVAFFKL